MANQDLAQFIRERAAVWDENGDFSPGSPFDVQVIQPIVRRLGADPFSVDFITFAQQRINEKYSDIPTKEGDAITDLLIKIGMLLLDPLIREIVRLRQVQSFRDKDTFTTEEAEALCANLFSQRNTGLFARGRARLFFAQPQNSTVTPANYLSSKSGLHFFPETVQSISVNEMLINRDESGLYYFDINVIAQEAGDEYNIGPDELTTIANLPSAVRIINLRRFKFGSPEEDAVSFIDRTEQELTERSMVTLRGITSRVTGTFPEVSSLGVIGFNDPEMQRDVVRGGGLGPVRAAGTAALATADGENNSNTRRLDLSTDLAILNTTLTSLIGPSNVPPKGWVLTLLLSSTTAPFFLDIDVLGVVSTTQLDLVDQIAPQNLGGEVFSWTLRKKELTLSTIPGGIIFPDGPNGTVTVPDGVIHIGGTTDVLVRGTDLDTATLVLSNLTDDTPALSGSDLQIIDADGNVSLGDLVLDTNYSAPGTEFDFLHTARARNYSLQIIDGTAAGTYRILNVLQLSGASPVVTVDPPPTMVVGSFRWRLVDEIDVDLIEPKETRIGGTDMIAVQGTDLLETISATDFSAAGVAAGDVLRLENGADKGDFNIVAVLAPFFHKVQVDRVLTASATNITYTIFRRNEEGGVVRPLVRITSVDLLDASGQPVGSKVPYAKAVDVRSNAFANFAHGVKADVNDTRLGIVSLPVPSVGLNVAGIGIVLDWDGGGPQTVTFTGPNPVPLAVMIDDVNDALGVRAAYVVDGDRLGIAPLNGGSPTAVTGGLARPILFGTPDQIRTSLDIRSDEIDNGGGWGVLPIPIEDQTDVVQVLDGFQIGFYGQPVVAGGALLAQHNFAPEARRHVQVGARSVGTARVFFLEPTSVEFTGSSRFLTKVNGVPLRFLPDLTVSSQRIPGRPAGEKPKDGSTVSNGNVLTTAIDLVKKGALPNDLLVIDFVPLTGSVPLSDPVSGLATNPLTYVVVSIGGGPDRIVNFVRDSTAIPSTAVTRKGIADQINRAAGRTICSIVQVGLSYYLQFSYDGSIVVRSTGTANTILGFSTVSDQNNDSPHQGTYRIEQVAQHTLTIDTVFPNTPPATTINNQQFKVLRQGTQRFGSTEMSTQKTDAGLYYVDVELVSEGTGDLWNITAGLAMTVEGYDSDGYWLTTDDPNLTFSTAELVRLHISKSVREVGVDDDPENATQISGQNIQITYDRSSLTASVENFISAETERVICESPLARHLIPYFVRTDIFYSGGSTSDIVVNDIESFIRGLRQDQFLEVGAIEKMLSDRGATSITNPINLVAIVHGFDRTLVVERSQDRLSAGRLAAFIPDGINVTRKTG